MKHRRSLFISILILLVLSLVMTGCDRKQQETIQQKEQRPLVASIGSLAPDFDLQDIDGNRWRLSDLEGQVVFINFWATWCPPCREEMPSMQELYDTMPKDRFKMLSILSNDDPTMAASFAAKGGFKFPILIDPYSKIGKAYGLTGVPETFIVDKQGILRQKYIGPRHWSSPEAKQMLTVYINRKNEE